MFKKLFFLFLVVSIFFFFKGRLLEIEKWRYVADLPEKFVVKNVSVDKKMGLIGGYLETHSSEASLEEKMFSRSAILWRLKGSILQKVYEGPGWIHTIHNSDSNWYAIAATLKRSGEGSDYRLIVSTDRAQVWQELGDIPAISISQVIPINPSKYMFLEQKLF